MFLSDQLRNCYAHVDAQCAALPAPYPAFALFFSVSDGTRRAHVVHACGADLPSAWNRGVAVLQAWMKEAGLGPAPWLRVDWVEGARAVSWERLAEQLSLTKRNYFRLGLALDEGFDVAFTEQELNANAMLSGAAGVEHAMVNVKNWRIYGRERFGAQVAAAIDIPTSGAVYLLSTRGVFCKADGLLHPLGGSGLNAGRREIESLTADDVLGLVRSASSYLARQVKPGGAFTYGYFPCFDRPIGTYNTLRHASTLYAMIEAWELTREPALKAAIDRALEHLSDTLIRTYPLPGRTGGPGGSDDLEGDELAFLIDTEDEIKLGGNAVCLLALVKYCEAMDTRRWQPLMEKLAQGIVWMQHEDGRFDHVLNAGDLSLKQASRIVYYDGEAAFGLMRLYGLTRDARWLSAVEKAFGYFIGQEHWRAHDHWLGHAVNELTRWRVQEKYFRFGVLNVADHLDFVLERKTTFPTLLELMLSADELLQRLRQQPQMSHLLEMVDQEKFERALAHRAGYLLNGYFWPELAMYFKSPGVIEGSFFIRHQSFRVRIDDVEHYLSGFVGYHRLLKARAAAAAAANTAQRNTESLADAVFSHRTVSA